MKSISRGILALILAAAILMLSDLQNRNKTGNRSRGGRQVSPEALVGKKYTMGLCYFAPEAAHDELLKGLWTRLRELGYVRDSNLIVKESHANGEIGNISPILLNLDNQNLDLILVTSTPCVTAAVSTVRNHPVAFTYCYDPIAAGAGTSYEEHLPGITGIGSFPPIEKSIRFILETMPHTKKIGTIYNTSEANSRKAVSVMREVAGQAGVTLVEVPAISTSEVFQAVQVITGKGIDVLYITGDNTAIQAIDAIAGVCEKHNIPLIVNDLPYIQNGALAAVGIGWESVGYHSGNLIGRLLNGAPTADIPMENYVNEMIAINPERVSHFGLTIPESYLNPAASLPQGVRLKLCLVHFVDSHNSEDCEKGLRKALADNKLEEGVHFTMKVFNAQGDVSTLNSIAGSVESDQWDLIFATSTPTIQMLAKKLPGRKIVFTNVGDPIAAGLGRSDEDHLPGICGISTMSDFEGLIRLALHLQPGIKRVGTVFTPAEVNSVAYRNRLEEAATAAGLTLISVPANTATEVLDAANSLVSQRIDAFCQISDNLTGSSSSAILKVSIDSKVSYYGFVTQQLHQGGVAVCARDYYQAGYEAGEMGIEVLTGRNPAGIPFRNVRKTDYLFSKAHAALQGIRLPENTRELFPTLTIIDE
ncbi:MAG: ABC transporter substrate-binding protein [Bacteroidales bacterium]